MKIIKADDFERRRVAFVTSPGNNVLQFITSVMMVKRFGGEGGAPPQFAGPVYAGWENLRSAHGDRLRDLELVGALASVPDGEWAGQIDWIKPVDGGKIADRIKELSVRADTPEAPTHQTISLPIDLEEFSKTLMFDPQLNLELRGTSGGADMIHAILSAAVRLAKGEV